MILIWPSDSSWWIRSKTQFSACLIFQCQNYLQGKVYFSALAGWPPTGITMSLRWCLLRSASFCKPPLPWILYQAPSCIYTLQPKWIPPPQIPVLHVLLAIALLLTHNPHSGQRSRCWGTRWCSSFSPGAISSNIHSYLYGSRLENFLWSVSNQRGQIRGLCNGEARKLLLAGV